MMRAIPAAAGLTAALALAACGSSTNATTTGAKSTPTAQPSGGPNGFRRNAAAGELVQIAGTSLVLNTTNGDVTVNFTGSTPVTKTRTGTVADITSGSCIVASGQKDATGTVTASMVVVNATVNGSCQSPGLFGNGGGQRSPGASPRPSFSPRPGTPPIAIARGQVTGVAGTAVTVKQPDGTSTTITVPTTVHVSVVQLAATTDLNVGDCVLATGPRNSAGVVTARSLNIQPAGPSGCFTGGGGFGFRFGGGGGGGFGGGGGGGGFGGGGEGGGGAGA